MNPLEIERNEYDRSSSGYGGSLGFVYGKKSEINFPEWHRDILEERKRKIENYKAEFISLEELRVSRKL